MAKEKAPWEVDDTVEEVETVSAPTSEKAPWEVDDTVVEDVEVKEERAPWSVDDTQQSAPTREEQEGTAVNAYMAMYGKDKPSVWDGMDKPKETVIERPEYVPAPVEGTDRDPTWRDPQTGYRDEEFLTGQTIKSRQELAAPWVDYARQRKAEGDERSVSEIALAKGRKEKLKDVAQTAVEVGVTIAAPQLRIAQAANLARKSWMARTAVDAVTTGTAVAGTGAIIDASYGDEINGWEVGKDFAWGAAGSAVPDVVGGMSRYMKGVNDATIKLAEKGKARAEMAPIDYNLLQTGGKGIRKEQKKLRDATRVDEAREAVSEQLSLAAAGHPYASASVAAKDVTNKEMRSLLEESQGFYEKGGEFLAKGKSAYRYTPKGAGSVIARGRPLKEVAATHARSYLEGTGQVLGFLGRDTDKAASLAILKANLKHADTPLSGTTITGESFDIPSDLSLMRDYNPEAVAGIEKAISKGKLDDAGKQVKSLKSGIKRDTTLGEDARTELLTGVDKVTRGVDFKAKGQSTWGLIKDWGPATLLGVTTDLGVGSVALRMLNKKLFEHTKKKTLSAQLRALSADPAFLREVEKQSKGDYSPEQAAVKAMITYLGVSEGE